MNTEQAKVVSKPHGNGCHWPPVMQVAIERGRDDRDQIIGAERLITLEIRYVIVDGRAAQGAPVREQYERGQREHRPSQDSCESSHHEGVSSQSSWIPRPTTEHGTSHVTAWILVTMRAL